MYLPVTGFCIGALPSIINNEKLMASFGDTEGLAKIIIKLLDDPKQRLDVGWKNHERAQGVLSGTNDRKVFLYIQTTFGGLCTMKIAIFVHCFFPDHFYGTETYTLNIATNLIKLGHSVTVVTGVFHGESSKGEVISKYVYNGIDVLAIDKNFFPNRRVRDTYEQPEIYPAISSVLNLIQPDIIHVTHLINHTAVLLSIARELRIPTIATLTDFFGFCFTNKLEDSQGQLCSGPTRDRSNCISCYLKVAGTISKPYHFGLAPPPNAFISFQSTSERSSSI